MSNTTWKEANIHPEIKKLLDGPQGNAKRRVARDSGIEQTWIRVSKKQLWFFAYRSKEITGERFNTENLMGDIMDYPTVFCIGHHEDGSRIWAEAQENRVDGPFWVRFTSARENIPA